MAASSTFSPARWSIRVKSILLALGYLLVLSTVYGAFTVNLIQREITEARDRLQQNARIVAAEIDATLGAGGQRLETISRLPGLAYGLQTIQQTPRDGYIPPWTTLHYLFFKSTVFTGGAFLLDRNGTVLWTEPPGLAWLHQNVRDVPTVEPALARAERGISGVLMQDRLASVPHVVMVVPIANEGGEVQGALGGVIDLAAGSFGESLRPVSSAEGRFVEVVDQYGTVMLSTNPARRFVRAEPTATTDDDPMRAAVTIAGAPWQVIAGEPPQLGLRRAWRSQRALWGMGVILLLSLGATAVPAINGFVRAIGRLTAAAETVAHGDLSQPVDVGTRRDEIATLARAFEQMRVELESSRRALEQRLAEREDLILRLMRSNEKVVNAQTRLIETERFAAIGELSAEVAHGIRNPVAGIKMAAQLASLELSAGHSLRQNIDDIIAEADKLETRISTLLNFTKPFEPHPVPCRLDALVEDAVASLRNQAKARGVVLSAALCPDLPVVELDEAQIEQVLLALLSNAIEATPPSGRVTIATELHADGRQVRIVVSDTGSGIKPEHMARVFTLFFTTKTTGTGFGLPVAKRIVERHGGTIAVESRVGSGTRFTLDLPMRQGEAADDPTERSA